MFVLVLDQHVCGYEIRQKSGIGYCFGTQAKLVGGCGEKSGESFKELVCLFYHRLGTYPALVCQTYLSAYCFGDKIVGKGTYFGGFCATESLCNESDMSLGGLYRLLDFCDCTYLVQRILKAIWFMYILL